MTASTRRKRKRVYFDNNAFDKIEADGQSMRLLEEHSKTGRLSLTVSPDNLDEFFGAGDVPDKRRMARERCRWIAELPAREIFKPSKVLLWELGSFAIGQSGKPYPCVPIGAPSDVGQLLSFERELSDTELEGIALDLRRSTREARESWSKVDAEFDEKFQNAGYAPETPCSFAQFRKEYPALEIGLLGVSAALTSWPQKVRASRRNVPGLQVMALALLYRMWSPHAESGASRRYGHADILQTVFSSYVQAFVTEDGDYRKMLKATCRKPRRVMCYDEFATWLGALQY